MIQMQTNLDVAETLALAEFSASRFWVDPSGNMPRWVTSSWSP